MTTNLFNPSSPSNLSSKEPRTFAIGDIHGNHQQLVNLIKAIEPGSEDTLIFLGDYIDRGPKSKAVINEIVTLKKMCQVIMLKGNHEVMMEQAFKTEPLKDRHYIARGWLQYGGVETLISYKMDPSQLLSDKPLEQLTIPDTLREHLILIESLPLYHTTDSHIFVHASPRLDIDIDLQDDEFLLWRKANASDAQLDYTHQSGKTIICGHTDQKDAMPKRLSAKNIIIDTGCYKTGWLTAIDVDAEQFIQASTNAIRVLN